MITHLFYHQEKVEEQCAVNSWLSVRGWFGGDDEVIVLDLGNTITKELPLNKYPKYLRIEKIRTDGPEERSYTYGLNMMMPLVRGEWICLWRSDYIYNKKFYDAVKLGMQEGNVVLPYEAFIGANYCTENWCRKNLKFIIEADENSLLIHSHVCPTYEMADFPHFAIQKELWTSTGGMDDRLWGYGPQFPEFFNRLKRNRNYKPSIQFDMIAFHQTHGGTFGLGLLDKNKYEELKINSLRLLEIPEAQDLIDEFGKIRKEVPLRPLRDESAYKHKVRLTSKYLNSVKRVIWDSKGKGFKFLLEQLYKRSIRHFMS